MFLLWILKVKDNITQNEPEHNKISAFSTTILEQHNYGALSLISSGDNHPALDFDFSSIK